MKNNTKLFVGVIMFGIMLGLCACNNDTPTTQEGLTQDEANVLWDTEATGTLKIANNTSKDMVVFNGQTPTLTNIIGGVRAGSARYFNIEDDVEDFDVGGYMVLRATTLDEYKAKKANLTNAKMEFSAMATYGKGRKFSVDINPAYTGDFALIVNSTCSIGMELRKDSADGEKIAYLPSYASNYPVYANSPDQIRIFPVYIYFNNITGQITTVKSDLAGSRGIAPRPITGPEVPVVKFPADGTTWEQIKDSLTCPVAFVTCENQAVEACYVTKSAGTRLKAQSGYKEVNSGSSDTYEIESTNDGADKNLIITMFNDEVKVPVLDANGEKILIKNGYDYTITVTYSGTDVLQSSNYSAIITEGAKRDITKDIKSL